MKRFIRSIAGKTTLFFAFLLCLLIAAGSVAGAVAMANGDFYSRSETEWLAERKIYIAANLAKNMAADALLYQADSTAVPPLAVVIRDSNGGVVMQSDTAEHEGWISRTVWLEVDQENGRVVWTDRLYDDAPEIYTMTYSYDPDTPLNERDAQVSRLVHIGYLLRYAVYPIGFVALLLMVAIFVALICAAGRRPNTEELFAGPFFKIPFDLMAAAFLLFLFGILQLFDGPDIELAILLAGISVAVAIPLFLGLCMSFASRIKQRVLIQNTVIYRCCRLLWRAVCLIWKGVKRIGRWLWSVFHNIPMVWRTALVLFGICLIEFIFSMALWYEPDVLLIWWLVEKLILCPVVLFAAITLRKLQKAGEALAAGDLSYQVETQGLFWDFKRHAEHLNSISKGMSQAVEQRLKSERMKTELITNVSHDLKTPLTSILNYASLIAGERCDNPTVTEYAEVLVRQSEKLGLLIEDLVEASKASTGNLEVTPVPCDASVFLSQADGEYREKMAAAGLTLVTSLPVGELRIMADSRKMWRVFDNLMNNICKYSQSGTRVYLSLTAEDGRAVIVFKNTSRDPLNVSADELLERFVRGDASRHTEGNGLGLSIARSLAELQGGTLEINIDGDLFKVVLSFPTIQS